jgi:hypothetical protein
MLAERGCTAAAAMLVERGCTAAAAAVGGCPRIVAEGGATVLWVGCRSYGTSGKHH